MALFNRLYERLIRYSSHQKAPYYLAGVSFVESSVFPIPPDVMLIPMVLSKPLKAWRFAAITTLCSILGGILGYLIGYYAFEYIAGPLIQTFGYEDHYERVVNWFSLYGFWAVLLAGFTPIPYKVFTIAAGAAHMFIAPFLVASIIGRGMRFFLVAAIVKHVGKKLEPTIVKYIDVIGWGSLIFVVAGFLLYRYW